MKNLILLLLCCIPAVADNKEATPRSKQTDLQREGLHGPVKTIISRSGNTATLKNGQWQVVDTNPVYRISYYSLQGYDSTARDMIKELVMRNIYYWADDSLEYEWVVENGNEDESELTSYKYMADTSLLMRSYITGKDTIIVEQTDETVVTYVNGSEKHTYYAIDGPRKKKYMSTLKTYPHPDTFITAYYSDVVSKMSTAVLQRDKHGNPTKELSYSEGDTSIILQQYIYY